MRNRLRTIERKGDSSLFFASHQLKAFTRFESFPEMLLFGKIASHASFIMNALNFFCYRFPPFVIALYNTPNNRLFVQSKRKDFCYRTIKDFDSSEKALEWLRPLVQKSIKKRLHFGVDWKPEYFERFFETQFIENRKNLRLQKKLMFTNLLDKDSVEFKSLKKFSRTLSNTQLGDFFFSKTPVHTQQQAIQTKKGFLPKNAE
ncbi:DUF4130 domain-containing protein [Candidatus Micrarchaeota archaeon]|nr:DUF4130 domain-containing protein [Candidatus Micrarchaeota archaeon]MBU1930217.1 DUF4130 domain-containing protein [Candidatus Micrarchaeota archaeon]